MTDKYINVIEKNDSAGCDISSSLVPLPGAASENILINGDMRISQRGTSFAAPANGDYLLDRWLIAGAGLTGNVTVTQSTDVPLTTFTNSLKVVVNTAKASLANSDVLRIQQKVEGYNAAPIGLGTTDARSFSVSFWVKAPSAGTYYLTISPKTGTTQYYPASYTIDAANTWEQKSITIPGTTSGTFGTSNDVGLFVEFMLAAGSDWEGTANDWNATQEYIASGAENVLDAINNEFLFTGVKLEVGETATPFVSRSYGEELALCQRYYAQLGTSAASQSANANEVDVWITYPVTLRRIPTTTLSTNSPMISQFSIGNSTGSSSAISAGHSIDTNGSAQRINGFTGLTSGNVGCVLGDYFIFDAEL